jgi:hypothetical protein
MEMRNDCLLDNTMMMWMIMMMQMWAQRHCHITVHWLGMLRTAVLMHHVKISSMYKHFKPAGKPTDGRVIQRLHAMHHVHMSRTPPHHRYSNLSWHDMRLASNQSQTLSGLALFRHF